MLLLHVLRLVYGFVYDFVGSLGPLFDSSVLCTFPPQKPANILVMGEGAERGRIKIGNVDLS